MTDRSNWRHSSGGDLDAEKIAPNQVRPSNVIIVGARMTEDVLDMVRTVEDALVAAVRAEAVAAERERIMGKLGMRRASRFSNLVNRKFREGWLLALDAVAADLAAGSVPVATSTEQALTPDDCTCEDGGGCIDYYDEDRPGDCAYCQDPRFGVNDGAACPAITRQPSGDRAAFDRRASEGEAAAELLGHRLTVGDAVPVVQPMICEHGRTVAHYSAPTGQEASE